MRVYIRARNGSQLGLIKFGCYARVIVVAVVVVGVAGVCVCVFYGDEAHNCLFLHRST